jgi:long-chain acyl-CoA synthetase
VFVGYYKDPESTAQVLKEGWFFSGDRGFVREDGHIVFLDRLGELIELASGDELAPQLIESRLKSSPYIKDAWVLAGPERAFASAIIVIDYDNVSRWAGQRRVSYTTFTDLSQKPEVYGLVKMDIDRINQDLSPNARVKKYVNLHKEFDPDEGELTRTRKLRKRFLEDRYRELIHAIYHGKTEVPVGDRVSRGDERTGTIETKIRIETVEQAAL